MMKGILFRLAVVCTAVFMAPSFAGASVVWYNPEKAGFDVIQGQAFRGQEREGFYHRFPAKAKGVVRSRVWNLSRNSAGESIVFTTDAKEITVRYIVTERHAMPHMSATGVSGVDLYTSDKNGNEIRLAGKYQFKDTVTFRYGPVDIEKRSAAHRYTLFLPLYNEVKWMEIGVNEGALFKFEPAPQSKPIVAYGTSICQGACASRPAMAWSNILQRRLDHEFVNLGFSGNALCEAEVIDLLAEIDAKVYIFDAMPNVCSMKAEDIRDTVLQAIRTLRARRPDTPILIADHAGYSNSKSDAGRKEKQNNALQMQKSAYETLLSEGVKGLYYVTYDEIAMPQDGTVEGVHMTDYGMVAYADAYGKKLREILDEPVGSVSTTVPVTQQRDPYIWLDRHNHIVSESAGKHYSRVLIGDSIMHFWGGADDAPAKNGLSTWSEFEGATLNMGCGYDRVENVLWRIYHGQLDGLTADRIYLTIGTNNISSGSSDEEIAEGISLVLSAIKSRRPEAEVKLMGIFPRRKHEARVKTLNKRLKGLATDMGVTFEDPGKELLVKGKIDETLFTDGLHPNEAGYRLLAPYYK